MSSTIWREVSLLATETSQTESQAYKQLSGLGVIVINGKYHQHTYLNTAAEGRGPSTAAGLPAINSVLRRVGVDIRQHMPGNMLNVRESSSEKRATLWIYHNHYKGHTFRHKCGFMRDTRPEYLLFLSSPDNIAYVHRRSDLVKMFTDKKKLPEHITIPEGWEEHETGCMTFKFVEGQPEQLKMASQLGF